MSNEENTFESVRETIKQVLGEVEKHNNVKATFGDPIHEKDIVIIPVSAVSMSGGGGGGGGEGEDSSTKFSKGKGKGMGIGYSRKVRPLGYIELKDSKATFKPIVDASKIAAFSIGAAIFGTAMVALAVLKKKKTQNCDHNL